MPSRQAPPPPRPSLQLSPGSPSSSPDREALPQRASLKASKKGPPPPEKPSRQHNQDSLRSNYSDTTLINHSPKSSYRSHHYDSSSDYTSSSSNRSTFKGVFSNIVSSMSGNEKTLPQLFRRKQKRYHGGSWSLLDSLGLIWTLLVDNEPQKEDKGNKQQTNMAPSLFWSIHRNQTTFSLFCFCSPLSLLS